MPTVENATAPTGQSVEINMKLDPETALSLSRSNRIQRLSRPFWTSFAIGAISLLVFAGFLVNTLDRHAIQSSEQVFGAILDERTARLSELTLEYAFWDEAVEHLVYNLDIDWVETNFVDYIYSDLGILGLHLLDQNNADRLHLFEDELSDGSSMADYGSDAVTLINRARRSPDNETPVPAAGFLGSQNKLFLASAARMTTYTSSEENISTDHVMMMTQALNEAALAELGRKFQLPNLHISTEEPTYFQAQWPIKSADGMTFAHFIWNPVLPGQQVLPPLALVFLKQYTGMMISALVFLKQATRLVAALEKAKLRTEEAKNLLASQVKTDPLTGLGNRRDFEQVLDKLSTLANGRREFALMCIDLDRFKVINDTLGHETGDEVLKYVAETLNSQVYPHDKIFRLGGDEFVIIFGTPDKDHIAAVGQDTISILSRPLTVNGNHCHFGASVGVAYSTEPVKLLRRADAALYTSKRKGRGKVSIYVPDDLDRSEKDEAAQ